MNLLPGTHGITMSILFSLIQRFIVQFQHKQKKREQGRKKTPQKRILTSFSGHHDAEQSRNSKQ